MIERVREIVEKPINEAGFILSNIEYVKEGTVNYLRIFIDKKGYVNLDDCVLVTNIINPLIDKADPIEESYVLEISSTEKGDINE